MAYCKARGYACAAIEVATAGKGGLTLAILEAHESGRGLPSLNRLTRPEMLAIVEAETVFEDAILGPTVGAAVVSQDVEDIAATAYSGRGIIYVQSIQEA